MLSFLELLWCVVPLLVLSSGTMYYRDLDTNAKGFVGHYGSLLYSDLD